MLVQTRLQHQNNQMVAWLPVDSRVKVGSRISLKNEPIIWEVKEQYSTAQSDDLQRGWGLSLPKNQRTER